MSDSLRLYHYWRSTSSWRVRWALALKGISVEYVHVSLLDGESESEAHRARNPFGYVPVLEFLGEKNPERRYLVESLPIIEFLEETMPGAPLLPKEPRDRAHVRSLAEAINAGTQPVQNLSVQIELAPDTDPAHAAKRKAWAQIWIRRGLAAYETLAKARSGKFSFGDSLTLADLCLIPQVYNAARNDVALTEYPTISRIYANALETESYRASEPERFKP
ncbi:MAG: maleylacetoacetate isomerase [Bdellovibrionales bacterium]|nr:maleylacetoacetate isomerase [Bdellovibrionales bacterium]